MSQPFDAQFLQIEAAAHQGAHGHNPRALPTDAQHAAGNYKKGRTAIHGLRIAIEQPRGSYRSGRNRDGSRWSTRLAAHYGYFEGVKGADGDELDCFVGFYPQAEAVYIINQQVDGRFDEHKVMLFFPDQASAERAYRDSYERGWTGLHSVVAASVSQFKWWLKNGDKRRPMLPEHLPHEGSETMMNTPIAWDASAQPVGMQTAVLLYQIRCHDAGAGLLLDAVTCDDILDDADEVLAMDAMVTPYAKVERKMDALYQVMQRASATIKPIAVKVTEPFKPKGVSSVNVAGFFELSDGQTVSVYLHNPDTTPQKLAPTDELISWKWLLNKKDITIVVAPERGEDLNVREVARRIMKLAEKNSSAFQRVNAKRAERMQAIQGLRDEITALETELDDARKQLEAAKVDAANRTVKPESEPPQIAPEAAASIELTGKELGDFPDTEEGKTALRQSARKHLEKLRGKWVKCPAMPKDENGEVREVELRQRGIDEFIRYSGNPDKLRLAATIERIIETAKDARTEDNFKKAKKPSVINYYRLSNRVSVGGRIIDVAVLIEQDVNGYLHYDFIIPSSKAKAALDSSSAAPALASNPATKAGVANGLDYVALDAAGQGGGAYVFNLLIDGEEPEKVDVAGGLTDLEGEQPGSEPGVNAAGAGLTSEGRESKVKTAKGTEVVTGFTVVDADMLVTSHDPETGAVNPKFPPELQPRDRGRDTSRAWVIKTAGNLDPEQLGKTRRADTGAPIVGPDGIVESGNGRTMAIVLAYASGKAGEYREWLESEADYFGLSVDKIKAMRKPVLVRVRTSQINRAEFAVEANQDDKLAMTATEKARADARRLTDDMIALMTDNGDLAAATNQPFLSAFLRSLGDAEAAQYSTSEGKPTSSLIARVQAAIFAKAYNDDRLLELTADSAKPEIANIISALNFAAPEFIQAAALDTNASDAASKKLVDSIETSLNAQAVSAILGAANVIKQARDAGMQVEEFIKQQGLFGDIDPSVAAMAVFISKNNRSGKRMGTAFKAMATFVKSEIQRRQTEDMFGTPEPIGFEQIVEAANREMDKTFGEGSFAIETADLFVAGQQQTGDAEPPSSADIEAIFTGLDGAGLVRKRAQEAADSHPLSEAIWNIQNQFTDILGRLEAAGRVTVNR